jgi:hypothetical protein
MWRCPSCSEEIEDGFDACWKCGTGQDGEPAEDFQPEPDDSSVPGPEPEPSEPAPAEVEAAAVDELVTIATYDFPAIAEIERSVLDEEDIPAFLADDNLVATNWLLSNAVGGAKLRVAASNVPRAVEILDAYRASHSGPKNDDERPITFACEECGEQITVPGDRRGHVEVCPLCNEYVDVPE